jgi:hypothetical protein
VRHHAQDGEAGHRAPCAGESFDAPRRNLAKNTDAVATVIAEKVRATDGRISAKRLLPLARTAGLRGRRATPASSTQADELRHTTKPSGLKTTQPRLLGFS